MDKEKFQKAWSAANQIPGWLTEEEAALLFYFASKTDGQIVELGSYKGRSTTILGFAAHSPITAIDTFKGSPEHGDIDTYEDCVTNLRAAGVYSNVQICREDAVSAANHFLPESISLLFVDADHDYEAILNQLDAWLPKLAKDSVVILHDVGDWAGPTRAASDLLYNGFVRVGQANSALALQTPERSTESKETC